MVNASQWVTSAQAAEALGVHVNTINRMAGDGRLRPAAKAPGLRGAHLFDRDEVDRVRIALAAERRGRRPRPGDTEREDDARLAVGAA